MSFMVSEYSAYLLRLWPREIHGKLVWFISVENIHTGEQIHLTSPEALIAWMRRVLADSSSQTGRHPPRETLPP